MDCHTFHHCCGIVELGGFGTGGSTKASIEAQVKQVRNGQLVVASVNDNQKTTKTNLLAAGFQEVAEFRNPESQNLVTMLARIA